MNVHRAARRLLPVLALAVCTGPLSADPAPMSGLGASDPTSFAPLVPVSAFARPASWLDMSRLHVSTSVSVGSGFGGGTAGLQVTSLSYQLASPLAVRLSIGNTFGNGGLQGTNGMFLEGFSVAYRPHPSFQINVDYRDVRSPLQYSSPYSPFGYSPYGYSPYGR